MASLGSRQSHGHGFVVPQFSHKNDIRVLAKRPLQGTGKTHGVAPDLALRDDRQFAFVNEFDRILYGDDVLVPLAIDFVDHGGKRRGLTGTGLSGDKHET